MSSLQIQLLLPSLSIWINQVMNRKLFHNTRKGVNKQIFTVTLLSEFLRKCIHNSKLMNCIKTIPAIIYVINYTCNHAHKVAKNVFSGPQNAILCRWLQNWFPLSILRNYTTIVYLIECKNLFIIWNIPYV